MGNNQGKLLDSQFMSSPPKKPLTNPTPSGLYAGRKSVKIGPIYVHIVRGRIQDEKANVIVNCAAPDLDLSKGHTTSALSRAAGAELQSECNEDYGDGIEEGEVAITRGGNLKCNRVYHITIPKWKQGGDKAICKALGNVLEQAHQYRVTSLVTSPFGTGYLNYNPDVIATQMFQAVTIFAKQCPSTKIRHFTIITFTDDVLTPTYKALEDAARKIAANPVPPPPQPSPPKPTGSTNRKSVKIGGIGVCVIIGRIQNEKADVIVNCAAPDLDLTKGHTTSALWRAAGDDLQNECNEEYKDGIKEGEVAITRGGSLKCNRVYHVTIPKWKPGGDEAICEALGNVLEIALQYRVTSLATSPFGTGYLNYKPDVIATQTFQAVTDFVNQNPSSTINTITIVVFTDNFLTPVFQALEDEARKIATSSTAKIIPIQLPPSQPGGSTNNHFKILYKQTPHPPPYWCHYDDSKSLQDWNITHTEAKIVTVDQNTHNAITKLVYDTWKQEFVGHGQDAAGLQQLGYTKIQVKNVERVENPLLFEKYSHHRADMFRKAGNIGSFQRLETISCVQEGPVLTSSKLDQILTQDLHADVNEHYLFHGTCPDKLDIISTQGLDFRLASTSPALGRGIYAAESSTKSDQYADPVNQRDKTSDKKMILLRMCLGEMYVQTNQPKAFKRPPCKKCYHDNCQDQEHGKSGVFNSVVADKLWNFREFVVYDRSMCYPEYIITYRRV